MMGQPSEPGGRERPRGKTFYPAAGSFARSGAPNHWPPRNSSALILYLTGSILPKAALFT